MLPQEKLLLNQLLLNRLPPLNLPQLQLLFLLTLPAPLSPSSRSHQILKDTLVILVSIRSDSLTFCRWTFWQRPKSNTGVFAN